MCVGTCWPWETAATFPSARRRKALRRSRGRRGAGAYRGGRPPTACLHWLLFINQPGRNARLTWTWCNIATAENRTRQLVIASRHPHSIYVQVSSVECIDSAITVFSVKLPSAERIIPFSIASINGTALRRQFDRRFTAV